MLASLGFAVSERRRREFDVLEVKGSTNEVSIYFYRHITDRIRSAKHDSCIAAGFWKWTAITSAREKSENEADIETGFFCHICGISSQTGPARNLFTKSPYRPSTAFPTASPVSSTASPTPSPISFTAFPSSPDTVPSPLLFWSIFPSCCPSPAVIWSASVPS